MPKLVMETDDSTKRKWCPLCGEWKAATAMAAQLKDAELAEVSREITYCPQCGALLRDEPDEPNEKPHTGG
jgi:ribosomal protein S27AE